MDAVSSAMGNRVSSGMKKTHCSDVESTLAKPKMPSCIIPTDSMTDVVKSSYPTKSSETRLQKVDSTFDYRLLNIFCRFSPLRTRFQNGPSIHRKKVIYSFQNSCSRSACIFVDKIPPRDAKCRQRAKKVEFFFNWNEETRVLLVRRSLK